MSTGVPGLRVGTGPRGSYIRVGAHGVDYRHTLPRPGGRGRAVPRPPAPQYRQRIPAADEVLMEDVTGATTAELADASPDELISQLNEAARHFSLLPLVILLWLPVVTIPLAILLRARDKARRTVVVFYEVEGLPSTWFQGLVDSFAAVQQCAAHWHVTAQGAVVTTRQYKVNSGASAIIRRDRGRADLAGPPVIASNIAIPSLHASRRSVYFLPDRIVIRDGRQYADMPYQHCRISGTPTRFIESGQVPGDAERVGTTWKYVNKGGGPDRRYKNNPQLPIMRYGELALTAQPGFSFIWQTSRAAAASALAAAFTAMSGQARHGRIAQLCHSPPSTCSAICTVMQLLAYLSAYFNNRTICPVAGGCGGVHVS
jgi:DNA polymerase-3 subunit epsilon